jgi:hypothetical protein
MAYGAAGAPIFRAFTDLESITTPGTPTVLGLHRRIASESRQALVWTAQTWPFTRLASERGGEVLEVVDYWRAGGRGPVWFLANPVRRDLAMIDRRARRLHAAYRWHPDVTALVALARPTDVDAWVIDAPRWMLGRGWSVTPEIGGVTSALGLGPHRAPAPAYLRRDPTPLRVVIGGRHLGSADAAPVTLIAELDGVEVDRWTTTAAVRTFSAVDRSAGRSACRCGAVRDVDRASRRRAARRAGGPRIFRRRHRRRRVVDVRHRVARTGTGPRHRTSRGDGRSVPPTIRVATPTRDLTLTIAGESPVKYFGRGTDLVVRAGTTEVARRHLSSDFSESITVPAAALAAADGRLTLEVGDSYVPAERGQGADQRQTGAACVYRVLHSPLNHVRRRIAANSGLKSLTCA